MTNTSKKQCFVVGPIGAATSDIRVHADWLLHEIIEPVMRDHHPEYETIRADKISEPGMIDSQIIGKLLDAELVIADMTSLNANAFYEMCIRHMAQKPTIHMFLEGTEIPFDVKPYRAIPFTLRHPNDLKSAQVKLKEALTEALADNHQVENPVTRARGKIELKQHATPAQQVLFEQIDTLSRELREIKKSVERGSRRRTRSKSDENLIIEIKTIGKISPELSKKVNNISASYNMICFQLGDGAFFMESPFNIDDITLNSICDGLLTIDGIESVYVRPK